MKEEKKKIKIFIIFVRLTEDGWKEEIFEKEANINPSTYSYEREWGTRFVKKNQLMQPESTYLDTRSDAYAYKCYCLEEDIENAIIKMKAIISKHFNYYFDKLTKIKPFVN